MFSYSDECRTTKAFKYVKRMLPLFRAVIIAMLKLSKVLLVLACVQNIMLLPGSPREFRGPGIEEKDEAPCERSKQKIFKKSTLENYCWFIL